MRRSTFMAGLLIVADIALASPAQVLDGKICRGTFNTGGREETSLGATHRRFFIKDGELWSASTGARFGLNAFRNAFEEPLTAESFSDPVKVDLRGDVLVIRSTSGAVWTVTTDEKGTVLRGETDPRGMPGRA